MLIYCVVMPQRSQSAPIRRRPPSAPLTTTTTRKKVSATTDVTTEITHNISSYRSSAPRHHSPSKHTPHHPSTSHHPPSNHHNVPHIPLHHSQPRQQGPRSARSVRDTLLDDFTTKFVKTRNELHARNQQCESLAQEIDKYKKVLSRILLRF